MESSTIAFRSPLALSSARNRRERGATSGEAGEGALVRRAQEGDRDACDALLRLFAGRVLRLCRHLLRSPEAAEDSAQKALLRLFQNLSKLDADRTVWPYLSRITVNVCRDAMRPRASDFSESLDDVTSSRSEPLADHASPLDHAVGADRSRHLRAALALLSDRERTCIVLRDIEGFSTRDIAELLGTTPTTVRTQISRGRKRLHGILKPLLDHAHEPRHEGTP